MQLSIHLKWTKQKLIKTKHYLYNNKKYTVRAMPDVICEIILKQTKLKLYDIKVTNYLLHYQ